MTSQASHTQDAGAPIAVYGATGHTGRLVAAELARRGHRLILSGRDSAGLQDLAGRLGTATEVIPAELHQTDALTRVARAADVLINCAGPFTRSGPPLAAAAVAHGCHYLDHAAEPEHIQQIHDTHHAAGVVVIPGMSFYGALADMLAAELGDGLTGIQDITVAYAVTGWRMTGASVDTAEALGRTDKIVYRDGRFQRVPPDRSAGTFEFAEPLGVQPVIEDYPAAGEVVTIPRHLATRNVRAVMTTATFTERAVFDSRHVSPQERARSAFSLEVRVTTPTTARAGRLRGADIYGTGALVSVEAATRLADGRGRAVPGALSPAQAFTLADLLPHLPGVDKDTSAPTSSARTRA